MIGVITGLRAEARCLHGLDLAVACSGARPGRARAEAARLLAEGATGVVSFGLAAGLSPGLRPGDLVLADAVILPDGRRLTAHSAWRAVLAAALSPAGMATHLGPIAGTDHLLAAPEQKQALFEATGALAADMESHAVADVATLAGKPFIVVRAIADAADQALPDGAIRFLGPDGRMRLTALIGVIARPWELAQLLRLGLQTRGALGTLHQVTRSAGSNLERPFHPPTVEES